MGNPTDHVLLVRSPIVRSGASSVSIAKFVKARLRGLNRNWHHESLRGLNSEIGTIERGTEKGDERCTSSTKKLRPAFRKTERAKSSTEF